jgi:hypothetical protein
MAGATAAANAGGSMTNPGVSPTALSGQTALPGATVTASAGIYVAGDFGSVELPPAPAGATWQAANLGGDPVIAL